MPMLREDALEYHSRGRPGKIAIALTKSCATQRDLSLAYTPGVAEPVREIHKDPLEAVKYTARGNLVAVVSNGTESAAAAPEETVRSGKALEPTFGGINLEDIKAPECFYIEEKLKGMMDIPVFHDDQHGTAIISGAALLNALEVVGKPIDKARIVISGAG